MIKVSAAVYSGEANGVTLSQQFEILRVLLGGIRIAGVIWLGDML